MSYTIEYNKQVFYIENGDKERTLFLFIRQGDNNVRDAHSNLRAKDWSLTSVGTEKELWKHIGRRMGSVNGGGLQKAKGWEDTTYFTPEGYIKEYRSKIKNAKPLETMLEKFTVQPYIYIRDTFENEKDKEQEKDLRAFIEKYNMRENGTYYYDKTLKQFVTTIQDVEGLKDFFLHMPKNSQKDWMAGYQIEKEVTRKYRGRW